MRGQDGRLATEAQSEPWTTIGVDANGVAHAASPMTPRPCRSMHDRTRYVIAGMGVGSRRLRHARPLEGVGVLSRDSL